MCCIICFDIQNCDQMVYQFLLLLCICCASVRTHGDVGDHERRGTIDEMGGHRARGSSFASVHDNVGKLDEGIVFRPMVVLWLLMQSAPQPWRT